MKKIIITVTTTVLIGVALILGFVLSRNRSVQGPLVQDSVVGCYAMISGQDKYLLDIASQEGVHVTGTLAFNNYQKDSSHGTFDGTYENGILMGNYSFTSEGMDSVMQVAFKKMGDTLVRGYGPVVNEGTQFMSPDSITYNEKDSLTVFDKTVCGE